MTWVALQRLRGDPYKREQAAKELVSTEESYVKALHLILKVIPLNNAHDSSQDVLTWL